jgi:hypothetical protein
MYIYNTHTQIYFDPLVTIGIKSSLSHFLGIYASKTVLKFRRSHYANQYFKTGECNG